MAQWLVTNFGGEIPLQDQRILPDTQAVSAWNVDLNSGRLEGLAVPELVRDLTSSPGVVKRAYRFPGPRPTLDPDVWLALPSPYSSVVRGPLANDTLHRIYWTNPDGGGAFWTTYARIAAGSPPYTLGFQPVEPYWIPNAVAYGGSVPLSQVNAVSVVAPGVGYAPGAVMMAPGGTLGIGQSVTQVAVSQTQVVSVAIVAGGSGGVNGQAVIQGTTGTGTKFSANVTIAGGALTAVSLISGGSYSANPVLGFDPVTVVSAGGTVTQEASVTTGPSPAYQAAKANYIALFNITDAEYERKFGGPNAANTVTTYTPATTTTLTGAAVSVTVGILSATVAHAGAYLTTPTNPVALTNYGTGGGAGATVDLEFANIGVPLIARSYLFTYVDQYGQESSPSVPSAVTEGASDGTWTVYGMSNVPPVSFTSAVYPTVTKIRIYRTVVGATTGGQFFQVAEIAIPPGVSPSVGWVDTSLDTDIVNNNTLETASWASPPAGLDGLTQLPGGMLVGFTENTIHFCEPNRPNVWPASYDLSVNYQIVGLGVWSASLVVLTQGYPSTGSGSSPAAFSLQQVQVAEPCISRGSIVTDLLGVYYAGPNGLVMLNYYGMQNQTIKLLTKNQWLVDFSASQLIACRHRAQYLALNAVGSGFTIDFGDPKAGLVQLNTFSAAVCIWNDVYSGDAYVMAGKKVYRWDSPNTGPMIWRWRSKRWSLAVPTALGACQVTLTPDVLAAPILNALPLDNGDPTLVLPADVNAVFRLYCNDLHLVVEKTLTEEVSIFRLPSGFKTFDWQFEIVSRVPVLKVELASTMKELKGV